MNIEFRITKLERLLSDVSLRRSQDRLSTRGKSGQTNVAAWNSLERDFRAALHSLKQQSDDADAGGKF